MTVLKRRAIPETRSESRTICSKVGSRLTMRRKASEIPRMISLMMNLLAMPYVLPRLFACLSHRLPGL